MPTAPDSASQLVDGLWVDLETLCPCGLREYCPALPENKWDKESLCGLIGSGMTPKKTVKSRQKDSSGLQLRALIHASELYTGEGFRKSQGRHVTEADMGRIPDGALVYSVRKIGGVEVPGRIEWVGRTSDIPARYARTPAVSLGLKQAVTAGFVDCHTHLVFGGDRSEEFALRCGGVSYEEIARRGGGIQTTVNATRKATPGELLALAESRVKEALRFGIRTLEIKSGYGLTLEAELKQLEVAKKLRKKFPQVRFSLTFLGAHAIPAGRDRDDYVREICEKMLPEVVRRRLADACDIFIDRGYFTVQDGQKIFEVARSLGLSVKVHADELVNTESAAFAADQGAWSADHLLAVSEKGIRALASSETVAVLLPATAFYLKASHAPARKLIEAGARVALSTDFNPGTSMTLNLPLVMTIAALYLGMTRAEILCAVTYNAARALRLHEDQGTLEPGLDARFTVLPFARFEESYYRFGW